MSSDKDNERHKAIELNEIALQNFSNYLRIQSVHPNVNYDECVYFLTRLAADIGLPTQVVNHEKKQVVIATWRGLDTSLPAVMLNSHMDVVPVEGQEWTHPPFGGEEHNGRIYGRGAQDMKSIGIQYLEAIRRLRKQGVRLQRTVHCTFVPDEEIGGAAGMKQFVKSQAFTDLNVGVALDEGLPSSNETFFVYYGERCMCHVTFHCPGHPGHGSLLLEDIAAEKVNKLLTLILEYRERQVKLLQTNPNLTIGDVNSVNVTMISGGQQANVLPAEITITIDCRIPVTMEVETWTKQVENWCEEVGGGVYATQLRFENAQPTDLTVLNRFWTSFKEEATQMGLQLETRIYPGGTDARFLRELNIPAFGFSPICDHPVRLHDADEYLSRAMFLRGIDIYMRLITALGDSS